MLEWLDSGALWWERDGERGTDQLKIDKIEDIEG